MTTALAARGADVSKVPPPAFYAAAVVGGALLQRVIPWTIGWRPATAILGGLILTSGLVLALSGVATIVRHRTTIVPHRAVSNMVTDGPYRFSRNPMYTGLAGVVLGAGLLIGTWWPIVALPLVLLAIKTLVIVPEERYLTQKFAGAYTDYRARVRRWL